MTLSALYSPLEAFQHSSPHCQSLRNEASIAETKSQEGQGRATGSAVWVLQAVEF